MDARRHTVPMAVTMRVTTILDRMNRIYRMKKQIFQKTLARSLVRHSLPAIHPVHLVNPVSIQFSGFIAAMPTRSKPDGLAPLMATRINSDKLN